jgi:hypothetical protein
MLPETASGPYLRLSPLRHGTDGFFAAALVREGLPVENPKEREHADRDHTDGYFDDLDTPENHADQDPARAKD